MTSRQRRKRRSVVRTSGHLTDMGTDAAADLPAQNTDPSALQAWLMELLISGDGSRIALWTRRVFYQGLGIARVFVSDQA
mmetsp:Transcript_52068/g.113496  ORF Transcript_52068/g.113496 Transcript_52068/m.113496 type:complete len:80 (-) Transcript_52068:57-296(-)